MSEPATIGEWLASYRAAYGITQRKAAALVGVPVNTWSQWERGRRVPSFEILSMLARSTRLGTVRGPACPCCGRSDPNL